MILALFFVLNKVFVSDKQAGKHRKPSNVVCFFTQFDLDALWHWTGANRPTKCSKTDLPE